VNDYLAKPVAPRVLRETVTRLLAQHPPEGEGAGVGAPSAISSKGERHGAHTPRR
jgi:DNA-binding response OmpR family regulator